MTLLPVGGYMRVSICRCQKPLVLMVPNLRHRTGSSRSRWVPLDRKSGLLGIHDFNVHLCVFDQPTDSYLVVNVL
jgi:hypothetical protein